MNWEGLLSKIHPVNAATLSFSVLGGLLPAFVGLASNSWTGQLLGVL